MEEFGARFNKIEQKLDTVEKEKVRFKDKIGKDLLANKSNLKENLDTLKQNFENDLSTNKFTLEENLNAIK